MEYFVPVNGFEGLYSISTHGRVYTHRRPGCKGGILSPKIDKDGYLEYALSKDGKRVYRKAHRLVAMHFVDGYKDELQVNHLDEDKQNNYYKNLQWCDCQFNINHSNKRYYKITHPDGLVSYSKTLSGFCNKYKLTQAGLYRTITGVKGIKQHKGYRAEYYKRREQC